MPKRIHFNGYKHCDSCKIVKTAYIRMYKCDGCLKTNYCSAVCQKDDWKEHKAKCLGRSSHPP
jgi:hypothetical protein